MPRCPSKAYSDRTPVSTSGVRSNETKTASAGADSTHGVCWPRTAPALDMGGLLDWQYLHIAAVPAEGDLIAFLERDGLAIGGIHPDQSQFGLDFQHPDAAKEQLGLDATGKTACASGSDLDLFGTDVGVDLTLQRIGCGFEREIADLDARGAIG